METLQVSSPRRHIHSSFPYYFYSTPASPSSDSISAFVTLCESRIKPNSDDEFAFSFTNSNASFDVPRADVAFADDLFYQGQLLPVAPPATHSPLKLPPRLQYIANIRKSLRLPRMRRSQRKVSSPRPKFRKEDDPFEVAVEKVKREDAPWCQLPSWQRRPKARFEPCESREADESRERGGIVEYVKSALISKGCGNELSCKEESVGLICEGRKESWISRWSRNAMKGSKERSKVEDEGDGKLVSLARCTTVSSYSKSQGHFKFLACFSFK